MRWVNAVFWGPDCALRGPQMGGDDIYAHDFVVGTFHSDHMKMFELNETYSNQVYESLSIDCFFRVGVVWGALNVRSPSAHQWRVVFSQTLLSAGLLEGTTIVSTCHRIDFFFPISSPHSQYQVVYCYLCAYYLP